MLCLNFPLFISQAHSHYSQLPGNLNALLSLHLDMLSSIPLMNHTQTDHHRGSYKDHTPVTSIPGNHKCWIGHSSKGEKLLIGSVTQVLRVPPRDRGSHYYSLMTMDTDFFQLLRSFHKCSLKEYWILVLLHIRAWQATASTHGNTSPTTIS